MGAFNQPTAAKAMMLIRKPVSQVFEAFVDPAITTKFWFTKSSGTLEEGRTVRWEWEMYGVADDITVQTLERDRRLVIDFGGTTAEWTFTPHGDEQTYVTITNYGFEGDGDSIVGQAIDSTEGFTIVLCGLKAWLEHGIALNLVADHAPAPMAEVTQGGNATKVDHIPVIWEEPRAGESNGGLVIWLPGRTEAKESLRDHLRQFASQGFIAVSYDPYEHGARTVESRERFFAKFEANKRRYLWPIIALTAEEYPRIIDWAFEKFGLSGPVMAGGLSMGGDIAVTAAGIDHRIKVVAAVVSTPDWLRPGSDERAGHPDTYALNFYHRCNPLTNLDKYAHAPAIGFFNGKRDRLVPLDCAHRFKAAVAAVYAPYPERFVIREYDVGHRVTDEMVQDVMAWFREWIS